MPVGKYFHGNGDKVMSSMKDTYEDPKKAKQVFYATANKKGENPPEDKPKRKTIGARVAAHGG